MKHLVSHTGRHREYDRASGCTSMGSGKSGNAEHLYCYSVTFAVNGWNITADSGAPE
jgi:hypothetical protein